MQKQRTRAVREKCFNKELREQQRETFNLIFFPPPPFFFLVHPPQGRCLVLYPWSLAAFTWETPSLPALKFQYCSLHPTPLPPALLSVSASSATCKQRDLEPQLLQLFRALRYLLASPLPKPHVSHFSCHECWLNSYSFVMNCMCHLLAPVKREKVICGCCCLLAAFPNSAQDSEYVIKPKRRPGLAGQGHPPSVLLQLVLVSSGILETGRGSAGGPRDVGTCTGVPRPVSGRAGTVPSTLRQLWASCCSNVSIEQG